MSDFQHSPSGNRYDSTETIRRLNDLLGVSQSELAELLGINTRMLQRWMASEAEPRSSEAQRLSIVVALSEKVVRAYTGPGVIQWFHRSRPQLDGSTPLDLLENAEQYPRLMALADATGESIAT